MRELPGRKSWYFCLRWDTTNKSRNSVGVETTGQLGQTGPVRSEALVAWTLRWLPVIFSALDIKEAPPQYIDCLTVFPPTAESLGVPATLYLAVRFQVPDDVFLYIFHTFYTGGSVFGAVCLVASVGVQRSCWVFTWAYFKYRKALKYEVCCVFSPRNLAKHAKNEHSSWSLRLPTGSHGSALHSKMLLRLSPVGFRRGRP